MTRDDFADFHAHPEWFELVPIWGTSPALVATMHLMSREQREAVIDRIVNPPVVLVRKPIPFVLPIKGSAL